MESYLILKLEGVMQAWGGHTFEDLRPSHDFPTRSGLLGLLAACLGLERRDRENQARLAQSVRFAVRADQKTVANRSLRSIKSTDYHTVLDARRANRPPRQGETVQSWREYLYDAAFTVTIGEAPEPAFTLAQIADAVRNPIFTPFLGRRACPLGRPLLHGLVEAESLIAALEQVEPQGGTIYSEEVAGELPRMLVRDVPLWREHRQFATRQVYIYVPGGGA